MDDSGTINPAALNAPSSSTIAPNLLTQPSPRGTKRNRSPDPYAAAGEGGEGYDAKTHKRNKMKAGASPAPSSNMSLGAAQAVQTPTIRTSRLPQASPAQASPSQSTPGSATKPPVVKALPTVRDHTTDQLGPEGDEYTAREIDNDGELKVSRDGFPQDGRGYKCRTFQLPNRGEKLFMLATECARVLGYRDSYLLFNKNRSLFKIIASQVEKENLISQKILPYSYRSRQIAIVTARSMYRQFGSRLIDGGRRVRDDYWESKARKQGFTEEDAAGEKRPGGAKARENAAQAASQNVLTSLPQGEIIYSNSGPGMDVHHPQGLGPVSLAPLPMIQLPAEDLARTSAMAGIARPRQEIGSLPYLDRIQSSGDQEILSQATSAAEWNKNLGAIRDHRSTYLNDYWRKPHEQPTPEVHPGASDVNPVVPQSLQSPQAAASIGQHRGQQDSISHTPSQMMTPAYQAYPSQQHPLASPVHRSMPPSQLHQGSPSMGMGQGAANRQPPNYGAYNPNQMWPPSQPQPSPLAQPHMSGYPQQAQMHSPMPPPQMSQPSSMGYPQMNPLGNPAYSGMNRSMYQPNQNAQFNMQSTTGQQPNMQGWSTPGSVPQNYGYQ